MKNAKRLTEWDVEELQREIRSGVFDRETLAKLAEHHRLESNERDLEDAIDLWAAGWTSETPNKTQADVMSWYWRAPAKGKRKFGRRYLSTAQAISAMRRAAPAKEAT